MKNPFIVLSGCLTLACACGGGTLVPDRPVEGAEIVSGVESSTITEFREDAEGSIWMNVSQNGLLRFDGRTFIHYTASSDPRSLSANMVNNILTDREGRLWAATQKGVDMFDREKGAFVHFDIEDANTYVVRLVMDPRGDLYAMTRQALLKFNPATGRFEYKMDAPLLGRRDPSPLFDARGNLWILADEEVLRYDADYQVISTLPLRPARNRIVSDGDNCLLFVEDERLKALDTGSGRFCVLPPALRSLSGREVSSVYDFDGLLLLRAAEGNFVYEKASKMLYDAAADSPYRRLLETEDGRGFFYDSRGNLWFAREGSYEVIRGGEDQETRHAALSSFLKDHPWRSRATDGRFLWLILQDNSLLTYDLGRRHISGITDLRPFTGGTNAHQVLCSADGRLLLNGSGRSTASVWTLTVDENGLPEPECTYTADTGIMATFDEEGGIWAAGVGTRFYHGDRGEPGSTVQLEPVPEIVPFSELSYACHVRTLRDGSILVGFTDNDPLVLDPRTRTVRFLNLEREHSQIFYFTMLEDSVGDLWIGSTDNGLFHHARKEGRTVHVTGVGTGIGDVQEDRSGRILILSDDKYLYAWNRRSASSVYPLWKDISGFPLSKHLLVLPGEGIELYSEGHVLRFDDSEMPDRELDGRINVTLASGNRELATFSTAAADAAGRIRLRINSIPANLNMHVSVTGGEVDRTYNYLYGINDPRGGMHEAAGNPEIALYGLSTGRNRIRFQVRRADTLAASPMYTVILSVKHLWYEWVILFASILLPALVCCLFWTVRRRKREAREARKERELQEEINLRNIDFFANISHEFRAPLTVINGAVSSLRDEAGSPEGADRKIGIIGRNVGRMLKLVTQMLDFNKLDHGMLRLNVGFVNVPMIIRRSFEIFEIGAAQKGIDFRLTGCDEKHFGFVDADKLEKIIYNLCSNALKFTPQGGRIDVDCTWAGEMLEVTVSDTGIGLQEDKIDTIFERFSQIEPARKSGGTGIGLYFTKALVELHHGVISAENRYGGENRQVRQGARFRFCLPLAESAYSAQEKEVSADLHISADRLVAREESLFVPEVARSEGKPTLLLIDDDYELVYYMRTLFSADYNVYFRFDALGGYEQVQEVNPDVIICDMMMLDVDGLQFCRMVKENPDLCHIPVIMLTARSSVDDQIRSLNAGADAYVIKPFDPAYLATLVRSMIDKRNRVREMLSSVTSVPEDGAEKINIKDKLFMDKVYEILESCLAEGDIDIDSFVNRLGISRSKFFYKIKALTGQTPGEFFTTYRLNRAARLIAEDRYKISAVAAMVGFSSPSHFSMVFKKQFGVLPSQYQPRGDA